MDNEYGFDHTFGHEDGKGQEMRQSGFPAGIRNPASGVKACASRDPVFNYPCFDQAPESLFGHQD